jgi:hypothetical protein
MEDKMRNRTPNERLYLTEDEIRNNLFVSQAQGWSRPSRLLTSDELAQKRPVRLPSLFDANGGDDE